MAKKYPFKFLDAYDKNDGQLFFGRDEEISAMYEMVFQSNILLVYGASGTGKTSLIQCGLASRFQSHDWLALNIRRGSDLVASFEKAIADAGGNDTTSDEDIDFSEIMGDVSETGTKLQLSPLAQSFKAIYLNYFRPVYLIFDQFEELFILGSKREQAKFIEIVKEILTLDQPVKMIFSIREEYLGHLFDFEKAVPQLMRKKLRVEPMNLDKVEQVIRGISTFEGSCISIKAGEEQAITESIFNKIKGSDKTLTIQLPYLQVFLDKVYEETTHDPKHETDAVFAMDTIVKMGDIGDVLRGFLDEQVNAISLMLSKEGRMVTADHIWNILSPFATLEGTKEPLTMEQLLNRLHGIDRTLIIKTVEAFKTGRILKDLDNGVCELMHDTLAKQVASKRTDEEIALLEVNRLISSQLNMNKDARELFTEKQLNFILPYVSKLSLTEEEETLIRSSEKEVKFQKLKKQQQSRIALYLMVAVSFVVTGLAIWALHARSKAIAAQHAAQHEKRAAESLVLSGQSHMKLYRYGDPTFGFRFAQYAYLKDTNNIDARRAIYTSIYQPWDKPDKYFRKFSIWHSEYVYSAVLSPDGKKILTACQDSTARIWDASTGNELHTLKCGDFVVSAVFSPDGSKIVTASKDKTARVWDAAAGKEIRTFNRHNAPLTYATFSPDGKNVISTSEDGMARIWDAATGEESEVLQGHRGAVKKAAFSPDGSKVLTIGEDTTVRVWDPVTGEIKQTLNGHENNISSAEFSNDGKSIVTASWDYSARIWDVATGKERKKLSGHIYYVNSAVFSKDDSKVLTASGDKTARIWNVSTGENITTFSGHISLVNSATFSHDETKIVTASGDHTAKIWSVTGKELANLSGHTSAVLNAYFTPDDGTIITASFDYSEKVWVASTGKELSKLLGEPHKSPPVPRPVNRDVFSPDSKKVLTIQNNNTVILWDVVNYKPLDTLSGHKAAVASAVFSHNGKTILTASIDKTAIIWDATTGNQLAVLEGHHGPVYSAFFSPDDSRIITRSTDTTTAIWESATGRMLVVLKGHSDHITSAVFSPDGTKVATASKDNTARVWNAATGTELKRFVVDNSDVYSAVFSNDNLKLIAAAGNNHAYIWDVETGKAIRLSGHGAAVVSAVFSPDGKKAVTASRDNTAKIWDAVTGTEIVELSEHTGYVHTAFFTPRGRSVITSSGDNTVRIWDTETGKEMATLLGSTGYVYAASMSPDATHVIGISDDHTTKIWLVSIPMIIDYMDKRIEDLYQEDKEKYNITITSDPDYYKSRRKRIHAPKQL